MPDEETGLWPYGSRDALVAAPLIWIILLVSATLLQKIGGISLLSAKSVLVLLGIGLLPVLLLLIDQIVKGRGIIDVKGVKIDFSQGQTVKTTVELPDNIGKPEAAVSDSSPMQIVSALEDAVENQVVRLDIKEGSAWWVSRLLALCTGAVRVGSPEVIVFVGVRENVERVFLGCAAPVALLHAITGDNQPRGNPATTYGALYRKAVWIGRQVVFFAKPQETPPIPFIPQDPAPAALDPEIGRYIPPPRGTANTTNYLELGEAALEQILMDQIGLYKLESTPDRLTLGRLEQLFAHCLYRDALELKLPKEKQLDVFLKCSAPYVALVSEGRYQGLIARADVNQILLRQVLMPPDRKK